MYKRKLFPLLSLLVLLNGCTTIPAEAPALSAELGKRISALQTANIRLLKRFFDQKRYEVDRFIEQQWIPLFAQQLFSKPQLAKAWDTIVRENNKQQRLLFLKKIGPKLQIAINKKRRELIQPLDALEAKIETRLREEYTLALSVNNSLTLLLSSAAKNTEYRQRYLAKAGINAEQLGKIIEHTDSKVAELLGKTTDLRSRSKQFQQSLQELKNKI